MYVCMYFDGHTIYNAGPGFPFHTEADRLGGESDPPSPRVVAAAKFVHPPYPHLWEGGWGRGGRSVDSLLRTAEWAAASSRSPEAASRPATDFSWPTGSRACRYRYTRAHTRTRTHAPRAHARTSTRAGCTHPDTLAGSEAFAARPRLLRADDRRCD
jgi:hypothetical protein